MKKLFCLLVAVMFLLPLLVIAIDPSPIKLTPKGDEEYTLEFENKQGAIYKFPYIANKNRTSQNDFKYGDKDRDLVFIEGKYRESMTLRELQQTGLAFNIGLYDFFVLSDIRNTTNGWDETAITHIARYTGINTSDRTLQFEDLATGAMEITYEARVSSNLGIIGRGELIFSGNTYAVYIGNVTENGGDNPLAIDMDSDGIINRSEIRVTTWPGGIIDLGDAQSSNGGVYRLIPPYRHLWINKANGIIANISELELLTKKGLIQGMPKKDESILTTIEKRLNNKIGIASMMGSNFNFTNPFGGVFFTDYNLKAELLSSSSTKADTASLTYYPRTIQTQGSVNLSATINITMQQNPGQQYILMMSLGDTPGFNLSDNRNIPLNPDAVFYVSLHQPLLINLVNSQGKLDSAGNAIASWTIPNIQGLVGLDVYFAFITIDPNKPLPGAVLSISQATKVRIS